MPKKDAIDAPKENAVEAAVNHGLKYLAQHQSEKEAAAKRRRQAERESAQTLTIAQSPSG